MFFLIRAPWVFRDFRLRSSRRLETDGPLEARYRRVDLVDTLHKEVWGQGFAPPVFSEEVEVVSQRLVGEKHLSLKLRHQGTPIDGTRGNDPFASPSSYPTPHHGRGPTSRPASHAARFFPRAPSRL